jgi:cytochrome c biogenesis protein CcdA
MTALVLAFLAGALTTVNPCVLPLLPVLIASAFASGRLGPLALGAGLIASFTIVGVAIGASGAFLGFDDRTLRAFAAILLVTAGGVLLVPVAERRLVAALAPVGTASAEAAQRFGGNGIAGQFGVGLLAGAIWTPCSGPSLGAAVALAADAGGIGAAALRMFAFSLGAATVIALLAICSQALIARRRQTFGRVSRFAKPIAGALFVTVGVAVLAGFDKRVEAFLVEHSPDWLITLATGI